MWRVFIFLLNDRLHLGSVNLIESFTNWCLEMVLSSEVDHFCALKFVSLRGKSSVVFQCTLANTFSFGSLVANLCTFFWKKKRKSPWPDARCGNISSVIIRDKCMGGHGF